MEQGLITTQELARLVQISTDQLYEMARDGRLPHYRFGRAVRWRYDKVLDALANTGERSS